ncbi:MAG: bifunctional DedA family/phosphatase PAP2 family protein [Minisyncoccia bacterium]
MDFLLNFLSGIQAIGHWGYLVAFLFAFLESLAMVGGFIPGSTAVVFLGFMCFQGYLNIYILLLVVVIGAISGDNISYWLGTKGKGYFKEENKILKTQHLQVSEKFFAKHGNKSIILGRFIGVIRPMVPFTAGLSRMKYKIFLFWTVVGGIIWATFHICLGYFFGGALELIRFWTHRIGLVAFILIVAVAIGWYLLKKAKPTAMAVVKVLSLEEKYLDNTSFVRLCFDYFSISNIKNNFYGWPLVVLGFVVSGAVILFTLLADNFLDSNTLNYFDDLVSGFFYFIRDPLFVDIFVWISLLCKAEVIIILAAFIALGFYIYDKKYIILPFLLSVGGSAGLGLFIKTLIDRPRPLFFPPVYFEPSWSFPSGHSILAVTLYGFLIYYFLRFWSQTKSYLYNLSLTLSGLIVIVAIGFSRLYLGVHYFSDVVGGYIIGFLILATVIVINEWCIYRGLDRKINDYLLDHTICSNGVRKNTIFILIGIFIVFFIIFGLYFYHPIYLVDPGLVLF